jgi:GntR family transcriptional regulator/MocR family aminotransferase
VGASRLSATARPFRTGTPALDLFPIETWTRLAARHRRHVSATALDYNAPGGYRPLREAIATHVASARGIRCTADQVIIVAGAQHGLTYAARMLLDPGDAAWLEEPSHLGARSALIAAGATIVPVPVDGAGIDVAEGVRLAAQARVAVVTPAHQHPLGGSLTLPRRLALLRWAAEHGAWVIEDDYAGLYRSTGRPMAALCGLDTSECVIYVSSFSETMFPALRLGFLVVPDSVIDAFVGTRSTIGQHPPTMDQAVLTDFIAGDHFARHLRRMRHVYGERGAAMRHAAAQLCSDELHLSAKDAGLHVTGRLTTALSDVRIAEVAAQRGIEVGPLSCYYGVGTTPTPQPGLVLGFAAVDPPRIISGMRTLAQVIRETT